MHERSSICSILVPGALEHRCLGRHLDFGFHDVVPNLLRTPADADAVKQDNAARSEATLPRL
jgi:hypothetical protein